MYNYYFNENMYRSNNDLYRNTPSLYNPTVGFNNGNMFSNLYTQYKNYKPENLIPKNEREKLLLELSQISFAAHELKLYLDLNPNDSSMLTLFNDYTKKANALRNEYESKYGILESNSDNNNETPFAWEEEMWPWEAKFNV
ncbi:MAG: spore coat protein CotJB [Firmicutes bacterium]|nr:spore coat protein CotJB [Bacillota bacterium]